MFHRLSGCQLLEMRYYVRFHEDIGRNQPAMRFVRYGFNALLAIMMAASWVMAQAMAQKETETAASTKQEAKADFPRLDAAKLPISKTIHVGGDPDWLGIGLGSVWVAVPKTNEVVRINPARNVAQARIAVDK